MVNANSSAVQAASIVVLVIATGFYAWRTHNIASATTKQSKATAEQAGATRRMAEEAEQQNRRSLRPVLDIVVVTWNMDGPGEWPTWVSVKAKNVGPGPAINISGMTPADDELGFEGGLESLGSLGPGQESNARGVIIDDGFVWLDYSDVFASTYRSRRRVKYEESGMGSGYALSLEDLELISRDP